VVPGEQLATASHTLDAGVFHVRARCFNRPKSCFCNIWPLQDGVHTPLSCTRMKLINDSSEQTNFKNEIYKHEGIAAFFVHEFIGVDYNTEVLM